MVNKNQLMELLSELKLGLEKLYGPRLKGVYLYGSYARGDQRDGSDLDILVVLDRFQPRYGAELDRSADLSADLSLKYEVSICKVLLTEEEWKGGKSPFLFNVREDTVAA